MPVDESVTANAACFFLPTPGDTENAALGCWQAAFVVTVTVAALEPALLVAVSVTVNVPTDENVIGPGFCCVDVWPLPKSQAHEVGLPVDRSANDTVNGATPDVAGVAEIAATGLPAGADVTVIERVVKVVPPAFDTVSFAVYVPGEE